VEKKRVVQEQVKEILASGIIEALSSLYFLSIVMALMGSSVSASIFGA
jgi:hypothetical protein